MSINSDTFSALLGSSDTFRIGPSLNYSDIFRSPMASKLQNIRLRLMEFYARTDWYVHEIKL